MSFLYISPLVSIIIIALFVGMIIFLVNIKHKMPMWFGGIAIAYIALLLLPVPQHVDEQLYSLYVNIEKHAVESPKLHMISIKACEDGRVNGAEKIMISNEMKFSIDLIVEQKKSFNYMEYESIKPYCTLINKNKNIQVMD